MQNNDVIAFIYCKLQAHNNWLPAFSADNNKLNRKKQEIMENLCWLRYQLYDER